MNVLAILSTRLVHLREFGSDIVDFVSQEVVRARVLLTVRGKVGQP
jgi:hypothetical protein